jgi:CheY-like chemotaxis protein
LTNKVVRLLIAEDDYLVNEEIKRALRGLKYEVVGEASNGAQALEMAVDLKPDAILMDIKMPEMSGIEAARKIRGFNDTVPIIAQTAFVMAEEKEESLLAGCNHFVTKPLDRTTIMELIDSYFK